MIAKEVQVFIAWKTWTIYFNFLASSALKITYSN